MGDIERTMVNGKSSQSCRPTVNLQKQDRRSDSWKIQQEPACPINVKCPELGERINDWLTYVRRDMDEKNQLKTSEVMNRQQRQSLEDKDAVLVCIYDRQCRIRQNRSSTNHYRYDQPALSYHELGNGHISQTNSNGQWTHGSAIDTRNSDSEPNVSCSISIQSNASCNQPSKCSEQSNAFFKRPNTDCKPPNAGFKQPNTVRKPQNERFKQAGIC
ncbi:uncharacterized protein LOC117337473 [Pecten maximus]|uniref:uncharacterized protein LOC117337473 n=1 Tax=Pecten maximus TaxID=6579 RepID=UPI001458A732|nr:uncharacterized protein LOC117337473 [Pecten maximus]